MSSVTDDWPETAKYLAELSRLSKRDQMQKVWSELHPDLKPYLCESLFGGVALKHPLMWAPTGLFVTPAKTNEVYEERLKFQKSAIEDGKWSMASYLIASPYRFDWLWARRMDIPTKDLRKCVHSAWTDYEFPHQSARYIVKGLFTRCGWMTDVTGTVNDKNAPPRPPLPPTLYRGVTSSKVGKAGFSWTADPQRAIWFAGRWAKKDSAEPKGVVYQAEAVPTHRLYAYFTQRGEAEFVINPDSLRNVTKLEV